jgi:hypothetical protein
VAAKTTQPKLATREPERNANERRLFDRLFASGQKPSFVRLIEGLRKLEKLDSENQSFFSGSVGAAPAGGVVVAALFLSAALT